MVETLDDVREDVLRRLSEAARDRRTPMHTPVVATADADARIMVLRAFDPARWNLRFHTDSRAPKVGIVERDPRIAVLGYDRDANLQIRIRGNGRIERAGSVVDAAWQASTNFARRCYLGAGPGEVASEPTSGLPPEFEGREPAESDLAIARENFALLLVDIEEVDWFSLSHSGHRRAVLTRDGGSWVTP